MVNGKNPCDVCNHTCNALPDYNCIFAVYARKYECTNYECFINYEGSCLLGAYENCGAWEG